MVTISLDRITLTQPDDWHLHVRDGDVLANVVPDTARRFARAIIMPNLQSPITTTEQALAYRQRILAAVPTDYKFEPLMTLYLTNHTTVEEIAQAKRSDHIYAMKYYPAGATTHSNSGVTDIAHTYAVLEAMQEHQLPLLMHGEVNEPHVDIFDREAVFIETILQPLHTRFPDLKIVLEHITTKDAAAFVLSAPDQIAATITAHHLLYNRNALFQGGIRPHMYCLPVLKQESHRQALIDAATSGDKKFFLGTDSAPHARDVKESACGCAGIYIAHGAIELYAEIFEQADALDKLEAFASFNGADFYGLSRNTDQLILEKRSWQVPAALPFGKSSLVPLRANEQIAWRIVSPT